MNESPWREVASRLVGVIDLKNGLAVHGVAGHRENYAPVRLSGFRSGAIDGNPSHLLAHYQELGLQHFYVADLDSLGGNGIQQQCIESLVKQAGQDARWIIDAGLRDPNDTLTTQWLDHFNRSHRVSVQWVVASECAINVDVASDFAQILGANRVILGIDFRGGQFIGPGAEALKFRPLPLSSRREGEIQSDDRSELSPLGTSEEDSLDNPQDELSLQTWIHRSAVAGIRSALILDVAAVGTSQGPVALSKCRRFRQERSDWQITSGGGCRSPVDVKAFLEAGCDDCMVATALHC